MTIPEAQKEYRFHPIRKWRFDYAWPEKKVAIEVEGAVWIRGRHTRGSGFIKDMEKYNTATAMGWSVLRFTPDQMRRGEFIKFLLLLSAPKQEKTKQ